MESDTAELSAGGRVSLLSRFVLTAALMAAVVGIFAGAGGWLTPRALTPARMVDTFETVNGPHPGFRRNHAKGVDVTGYFVSNGQGVALCKAVIFRAGRVPIVGRFALAGGDPYQADAPHAVRSMALLFELRDGEQWRTGMNNTPVFAVADTQAFHDLLVASAHDPSTGKPNPEKLAEFFAANPESARAMEIIRSSPVSSGFENSAFNSLNAFRFVSADGKTAMVRWSMVPLQPSTTVDSKQLMDSAKNYLFDGLIAAVRRQPLRWELIITAAEPEDQTDDSTIPWPAGRRQVDAGTLTIDHIESEDTGRARTINYDPLVLPDGMAPSDDPLLSARSAAYAQSFTRREGERKDPSAVSSTEAGK